MWLYISAINYCGLLWDFLSCHSSLHVIKVMTGFPFQTCQKTLSWLHNHLKRKLLFWKMFWIKHKHNGKVVIIFLGNLQKESSIKHTSKYWSVARHETFNAVSYEYSRYILQNIPYHSSEVFPQLEHDRTLELQKSDHMNYSSNVLWNIPNNYTKYLCYHPLSVHSQYLVKVLKFIAILMECYTKKARQPQV